MEPSALNMSSLIGSGHMFAGFRRNLWPFSSSSALAAHLFPLLASGTCTACMANSSKPPLHFSSQIPLSKYARRAYHLRLVWVENVTLLFFRVTHMPAHLYSALVMYRFNISCTGPGNDERLPMASTCFNQLKLPQYSHRHALEEKLHVAVHYGSEGFTFS